ncbi:hypothetical protein GPECTOR_47g342 [Gonium pectorale]|uniref:Ankyrin repeat domain-containing protein n=1 Tax=Gonium pectorale TaxID=33097 RepID=A0A150G893_GONPE|nr:hypothetical protein GPECTOR_47g342 [Gonium pectorale]|eukprot:KXZ46067.1 hypothetical protein GPECTOR_47g342 [Gonium pectorale]
MCQWLWDHIRSRTEDLYIPGRTCDAWAAAAGAGHRHVCEWLLAVDSDARLTGAVNASARGGHADLAEWLGGFNFSDNAYEYLRDVTHGCDLPTLQRAWPCCVAFLDFDTKEGLISSAAGRPTPDWAAKVEWMVAQGCPRSDEAADAAACLPNNDGEALARLTWLRGRGYPVHVRAVHAAAHSGNTAALLYLLAEVSNGALDRERENAVCGAVEDGHLAALQALHTAGWTIVQLPEHSTVRAARGGHLHVLAWLLDTLDPEAVVLNAQLFSAAAKSGNMELLVWLRQRGCPWDSTAYLGAAEAGWEAALEWLVEQGCPMEDSEMPYIKACDNGDLATARCLRRLGVPWGPEGKVFSAAAWENYQTAPLPLLRWLLLEEDCPVDLEAAKKSAAEWGSVRPKWSAKVLELLEVVGYRSRQPQRR